MKVTNSNKYIDLSFHEFFVTLQKRYTFCSCVQSDTRVWIYFIPRRKGLRLACDYFYSRNSLAVLIKYFG